MATVMLSACGTAPLKIDTTPIDRPKLDLPAVDAVKLSPVKFIVVTPDNIEQVIAELKKGNKDVVLFALTADGYQAVALNHKQMQNYIKQLQDQLAAYKKYYEQNEQKKH